MKTASIKEHIIQRVRMGGWLCAQLEQHQQRRGTRDQQQRASIADGSLFGTIFDLLTCGQWQHAIDEARKARHYNLALLLSLYKCPNGKMVREQVARQVQSESRRTMDEQYARMLELLAGNWSSIISSRSCLDGLNWLQILGVLIWYHCKPRTTLVDCVDQLECLMEEASEARS